MDGIISTTTRFRRTVKCKGCGNEYEQRGTQGCFGGSCYPLACPKCGCTEFENEMNVPPFPFPIFPSDLKK